MKGKTWTEREAGSLRELIAGGASYVDAARAMQERHGRRFTADGVAKKANRMGIYANPKDVPMSIPARAREEALRGELKKERADLKAALLSVAALQDVRDHIAAACVPVVPMPRQFQPPKRWRNASTHDAVLCVGDWQIGEKINANETDGMGAYDLCTAARRVKKCVSEAIQWLESHRSRWRVMDVRIPVLGDMVSGDIHEELRRYNEFPVPVAAIKAGELLADLVANLAPHARTVHVEVVGPDNHGRLTDKLQFKQGAFNNWNYVVYEMARARLVEHENVKMEYLPSPITRRDWPGGGVLLLHGHQVRAWMGIPFYGIQRLQGRKAREELQRALDMTKAMLADYKPWREMIMGHWHVPARLSGCIVNGSLAGITELDEHAGRYAKPSQTSFLWSPVHGPFNITEWTLDT